MVITKAEDLKNIPKDFDGIIDIANAMDIKKGDYPNATIIYSGNWDRMHMAKGWIDQALKQLNHKIDDNNISRAIMCLEDAIIDLQCYLNGK